MALAKSISKQEEVAVIALCISSSLLFSTMLASFGFMWNNFVFWILRACFSIPSRRSNMWTGTYMHHWNLFGMSSYRRLWHGLLLPSRSVQLVWCCRHSMRRVGTFFLNRYKRKFWIENHTNPISMHIRNRSNGAKCQNGLYCSQSECRQCTTNSHCATGLYCSDDGVCMIFTGIGGVCGLGMGRCNAGLYCVSTLCQQCGDDVHCGT